MAKHSIEFRRLVNFPLLKTSIWYTYTVCLQSDLASIIQEMNFRRDCSHDKASMNRCPVPTKHVTHRNLVMGRYRYQYSIQSIFEPHRKVFTPARISRNIGCFDVPEPADFFSLFSGHTTKRCAPEPAVFFHFGQRVHKNNAFYSVQD